MKRCQGGWWRIAPGKGKERAAGRRITPWKKAKTMPNDHKQDCNGPHVPRRNAQHADNMRTHNAHANDAHTDTRNETTRQRAHAKTTGTQTRTHGQRPPGTRASKRAHADKNTHARGNHEENAKGHTHAQTHAHTHARTNGNQATQTRARGGDGRGGGEAISARDRGWRKAPIFPETL